MESRNAQRLNKKIMKSMKSLIMMKSMNKPIMMKSMNKSIILKSMNKSIMIKSIMLQNQWINHGKDLLNQRLIKPKVD